MRVRVLIADDSTLFAEAVAALLETDPHIAVVGCAANGAEAVDFARKLAPDVVLMDIRMPLMDGIEATARITARQPEIQVLLLTDHGSPEEQECALGAGAAACITKEDLGLRLVDAVLGLVQPGLREPVASFSSPRLP